MNLAPARTPARYRSAPHFRPGDPLYYLPADTRSLIDVGCNAGETLLDAAKLGVKTLIGVDINPGAVATARGNLAATQNAQIHHCSADQLPVESGSMDCATCLEVLEHIPATLRRAAIAEIARVLRPGGTLILTTPHAGLFDFLDPENARFYVGWLYHPVSKLLGGGKDAGYLGQKHGVVPHHHFSMGQLRRLLEPHFAITKIRYRGCLAFPLATWLLWPFYRTGTWDSRPGRWLRRVQGFDARIDWGEGLSYNVVLVAEQRCT